MKRRNSGRRFDASEREIIAECVNKGYGYLKSIPIMVAAGFVDDEGNCTISERKYSYARKSIASSRSFILEMDRSQFDWADAHRDELLAYINARMASENK